MTIKMATKDQNKPTISIRKIIQKNYELLILSFYIFDLLPKMFCWKLKYWWKVINVVIVGSLAATVPLSFNSMLDTGMIKLRIFSIGISFLILCEIMTKNERS